MPNLSTKEKLEKVNDLLKEIETDTKELLSLYEMNYEQSGTSEPREISESRSENGNSSRSTKRNTKRSKE